VNSLTFNRRIAILIAGVIISTVILLQISPVSQPLSYHQFADTKDFLGIPNFWNVFSNIPFLVFGLMGMSQSIRVKESSVHKGFFFYWMFFFIGVALVCIGSGYYHWAPNNSTLVWDRLPMTLAFMSFFAFIVAERVNKTAGLILLPILLLLGIGSVLYWDFTETEGAGDLRSYGLVQFLPMIEIPLICFLFPVNNRKIKFLVHAFGWYALAKVLEYFDKQVFGLTIDQMGGHALKHFAAGMAVYALYKYAFKVKQLKLRKVTSNR
jgi:hypothetical protein